MGHLRQATITGLVLLLACSLAGVALGDPAGTTKGKGLVLEKDLLAQTVLLDGQIVLHVKPDTEILDAGGVSITLAELPTAPNQDGLVEITEDAMVRYEASAAGGKLIAKKIAVEGEIPD